MNTILKKVGVILSSAALLSPLASFAQVYGSVSNQTRVDVETNTSTGKEGSVETNTDAEASVETENEAETKRTWVIPHILERSDIMVNANDQVGVTLKGISVADMNADGALDVSSTTTVDKATPKILTVLASEVRGWNPETKEAVQARLEANDQNNDANDFGLYVAMHAIENAGIRKIEVEEQEMEGEVKADVSVEYDATLRFLGFWKRVVPATATVTADGETEVTVDAPLWLRLLSVRDDNENYLEVAQDIQAKHEASLNAIANIRG